MKREKVRRGAYHKAREYDKKYRHLVGGRSPLNMCDMKYYEYSKLHWYINIGDVNHLGYRIALYRFYKNLKYRKRYINLYKKMKKAEGNPLLGASYYCTYYSLRANRPLFFC